MTQAVQTAQYGSSSVGLGFKNRIINGAMVIDQRNAGASVTPSTSGVYTLDRFYLFNTQASKFSIQQNAGSVTPPVGFNNYAGITSTSAFTPAAGDFFGYAQHIEGFNTADLNWGTANAKTVTFSFWVRSSLTGTFGGFLKNDAGNRFYVYSYTISAANTWEQKTITIAGDTSGTWNTTNGIGIAVTWGLGAGATYTGGSASWGSTFYNQPSGSVNLVSTSGATFYITGVQFEVGSTATSFDYRPYGTELALCQRYYYRYVMSTQGFSNFGIGYATGSTNAFIQIKNPVPMRAIPSGVDFSALSTYSYGVNPVPSALTTNALGIDITVLQLTGTGMVAFQAIPLFGNNNTGAYIGVTAEL